MYDNTELGQLKAVLASWTHSQRLCKGFHDVRSRAHKTGELNSGYTLANMSWEQLQLENQWSNDDYTKEALRNRHPETKTGDRVVCDDVQQPPRGVPQSKDSETKQSGSKPSGSKAPGSKPVPDSLSEPPVIVENPRPDPPSQTPPPHHGLTYGSGRVGAAALPPASPRLAPDSGAQAGGAPMPQHNTPGRPTQRPNAPAQEMTQAEWLASNPTKREELQNRGFFLKKFPE